MDATTALLALCVALAVDHWLGEPRAAFHPVVWMGSYLKEMGEMIAPPQGTGQPDHAAFRAGALAWCGGAALAAVLAWFAQALAMTPGPWIAGILLGFLLKPMLAWRMLRREVRAVETALAQSLETGRAHLGRLVSRDVSGLSAEEVRESAIESLAENLNDSVVAPIFWFVVAGLPGAVFYRFANTADAMWGYRGMHGGRYWEWAGKWAARADDVLSWIPARITALVLAYLGGRVPYTRLFQQAVLTPSPNSGWPMAAMALALGLRLGKPGVYVLNAEGRVPEAADLDKAIALAWRAVAAVAALAVLGIFVKAGLARWA